MHTVGSVSASSFSMRQWLSSATCQTHRWREPSLNAPYTFVLPCLCKDIQNVVVNFRATTLGEFALQLQTRLRYLGRVRDGNLARNQNRFPSTLIRRVLTAQHAATPPIKKLSAVDSGRGGLVVAIKGSESDRPPAFSRPSASTPTTDAATEREHPAGRCRLPCINRRPRVHQSRVVALDAPVALSVDCPPRRNLLPLSQHICRVCPGHHSPAKKEPASECSPSVRLFNACSLAGRHH